MPSHTIPSALLNLYVDSEGAPWNFPTWREIINAPNGLFPPEGLALPKGLSLEVVPHILSFIDQYKRISKEEDRIKFTSARAGKQGAVLPGRDFWRKWVTKMWASASMHSRISDILIDADCHPVTILNNDPDLKNKPISNHYIPYCIDAIGKALYGPEALDNAGRLVFRYRANTQHLVQRTWINLCKQLARSKGRLARLETLAREAFNGISLSLSFTWGGFSVFCQIWTASNLPRES